MQVVMLKHYSYKVMVRVSIQIDKLSIERVKEHIESFIENDNEDPYLTFAEYYIYSTDKDGYQHTYFKEIELGDNYKRAYNNIPLILKSLKRLEKKYKRNKRVKYSLYINE